MNPSSGMSYTSIAQFLVNLHCFCPNCQLTALIHLLNVIDSANICKGNCKQEFVQLAHKEFFLNQSGECILLGAYKHLRLEALMSS